MLHTTTRPFETDLMALFEQVGLLKLKFHEFETLFADVSVLNEVAPRLFRVVHHAMWADMVMHLAKVTGPRTVRVNAKAVQNLTIRRLTDLVPPDLRADVIRRVDVAVEAAEFTMQARSNLYAHHELKTALSTDAEGITLESRALMREALRALDATLAAVFEQRAIIPFAQHIRDNAGGADALIEALSAGSRWSAQDVGTAASP